MTNSILIVDDRHDSLELLRDTMEDAGYSVRIAADSESAMRAIKAAPPDLLLLDLWLRSSREGGIKILEQSREAHPEVPVIMISAHGRIETAVKAIEKGAFTFLEKPINSVHLKNVVKRALDMRRLEEENFAYRNRERRAVRLMGASPLMIQLRKSLDSLADSNARVLFRGPFGSGREEAARYLHLHSPRAARPFGIVSTMLLSSSQNPSEELGAAIERVEGGTLLVEEAANLNEAAQMAVLRVLVDQTRSRVGRDGPSLDVRIVATSSRNLRELVADGKFRDDLYYRLSVVELNVPPLADRRVDIPMLLEHFMKRFGKEMGRPPRSASEDTMVQLKSYQWPGNVRELRNLAERLMMSDESDHGSPVMIEELPEEFRGGSEGASTAGMEYFLEDDMRTARRKFERRYLEMQIARASGNVTQLSSNIGMQRTALYRKVSSLGMSSKLFDAHRSSDESEESGDLVGSESEEPEQRR